MKGKFYLVLVVVFLVVAATGMYLRQRAKAALRLGSGQAAKAADCGTPAPPPPPTTPPPTLPGFAIEAACGTGADAAKTPAKAKGK